MRRSHPAHGGASAFLLLLALAPAGCTLPKFPGPQIQSPPPAFTMQPDTRQERRMFPDRDVVHHDAWVEASWGNFSGIYINGHSGSLTRADVEQAREAAMATPTDSNVEYGAVGQFLSADGRTSWGWIEHWRSWKDDGLRYVVYRAVIPYDTVSYAVEFVAGDPGLKIRPDSLQTIVASFAIGKVTWNIPLVLLASALALMVLSFLKARWGKRGYEQFSDMELISIPTDEDGEGEGEAPAAAGAAPGPPEQRPGQAAPRPKPRYGPVYKPGED